MNTNLKSKVLLVLFLALVFGQQNDQKQSDFSQKHQRQQAFVDFKKKFSKSYKSVEHETYRFNVFVENLKEIDRLNKEVPTATFGVSIFSDLTKEEFLGLHTGVNLPSGAQAQTNTDSSKESNDRTLQTLPSSWDIRVNGPGKLQAIKNQGSCGSCWAFSVSSTVEHLYNIKYGQNVTFSEQQQVDCTYARDGCQGGWFTDAYNFVKSTGLALQSMYPYTGVYGTCKTSQMGSSLYKITSYKNLQNDSNVIKQAIVSSGAAAVCVDATYWGSYKSGIYSDTAASTTTCNHAVTIIGYGSNYWLLRNSWGSYWGESGYIKVANNGTGGIRTNYIYQPLI